MSATDFKLKWGDKIAQAAQEMGVDPNVLGGVMLTESGGSGFVEDKMIIRFEASWFNHLSAENGNGNSGLFMCDSKDSRIQYFRTSTDQPWTKLHTGDQAKEWEAFNLALKVDSDAAYQSTAMGMGQIQGFNYPKLGYSSAKAMFNDFSLGESNQLNAVINFIKNDANGSTLEAFKRGDLSKFIMHYNGVENNSVAEYMSSLQQNAEEYRSIVITGNNPAVSQTAQDAPVIQSGDNSNQSIPQKINLDSYNYMPIKLVKGDSIEALAKAFGTTPDKITDNNGNVITGNQAEGSFVMVPYTQSYFSNVSKYTVQEGDNWTKISTRTGISEDKLRNMPDNKGIGNQFDPGMPISFLKENSAYHYVNGNIVDCVQNGDYQKAKADTPHEFQSALELIQASTRNTNECIAAREQQNTQSLGQGQSLGGYSGGISRC